MNGQARVFLIYGPRGMGKTTTTLKLADALSRRGLRTGGYFQRTTSDDLDRRGYDLVSVRDPKQTLPLARPGSREGPDSSNVCSFVFSKEAFATGLHWLEIDAASAHVLILDEISKLEVRGEGHAQALRWALGLGPDKLLLLSVRAEVLFWVVENFGLDGRIAGDIQLPVTDEELNAVADGLAATRFSV